MPMIPDGLYQLAEKKRRNRYKMIRRAREQLRRARESAGSMPGGIGSISGEHGGNPGSRTERAAMAVVRAEKALEKAMKWEKIFLALDEIYPADSDVGKVAAALYEHYWTQEQICRKTGNDRQTIRRRRDCYIYRLILLAAAEGLISRKDLK